MDPAPATPNLQQLLDQALEPAPCWIEPGILPKGGKMLFGGPAKIGKSFVMLELARSLVSGGAPFECPLMAVVGQPRVLLIEQELGKYGLQKRAKSIFQEASREGLSERLFYLSRDPRVRLDSPDGRAFLHALLADVRPNVLLLDPISKMHGWDEADNSQINRLFQFLDELIQEGRKDDLSVIFSHHMRKAPTGEMAKEYDHLSPYNFRGAGKYYDDPDTLVTMQRIGEGKSWQLRTRWETRQAESLSDDPLWFNVNDRGDLRVRWAMCSDGPGIQTATETEGFIDPTTGVVPMKAAGRGRMTGGRRGLPPLLTKRLQ